MNRILLCALLLFAPTTSLASLVKEVWVLDFRILDRYHASQIVLFDVGGTFAVQHIIRPLDGWITYNLSMTYKVENDNIVMNYGDEVCGLAILDEKTMSGTCVSKNGIPSTVKGRRVFEYRRFDPSTARLVEPE